jgi:hypothetical protein
MAAMAIIKMGSVNNQVAKWLKAVNNGAKIISKYQSAKAQCE